MLLNFNALGTGPEHKYKGNMNKITKLHYIPTFFKEILSLRQ